MKGLIKYHQKAVNKALTKNQARKIIDEKKLS
jgi:hypothetical protein